MTAADVLAIAERWTAADNAGDFTRHHEWMAPDTQVHLVASGQVITGPEGWAVFMKGYLTGLPDLHATIHDRFATDDRLAHRWVLTGTHTGDLFGMPATGRRVRIEGASVWECPGGRPARIWIYSDAASLTAQLTG